MTELLSCQRDAFSLPEDSHYLNCAYMSPLPRAVEAAGVAGIARKRDPSQIRPADFFTEPDQARALFARLIGAAPARVAIIPAVSYGVAAAARNVEIRPGANVVLLDEQFPSNVLSWRRTRAEIRTVGRGPDWSARLLDAIDRHTAVVAVDAVHWTDGTRFDLAAIGARAREVGAVFVVDATQSIGAEPINVCVLQPDVLVTATYKWLMGSLGIGFAYFGPRFDNGAPVEENWLSRGGSDDFRRLAEYRDDYRPGAARYDVGGRANFILPAMAAAALELILTWDPARIAAYCRALNGPLVDAARALGYTVGDVSHIVGLRLPAGRDTASIERKLADHRVFVSLRGSAVRVSPNVYNTPDDIAALVAALAM